MIPENIKKLLDSPNCEDWILGITILSTRCKIKSLAYVHQENWDNIYNSDIRLEYTTVFIIKVQGETLFVFRGNIFMSTKKVVSRSWIDNTTRPGRYKLIEI